MLTRNSHVEFPERAQQITKIWYKLPVNDRQVYLAKARENRIASGVTVFSTRSQQDAKHTG